MVRLRGGLPGTHYRLERTLNSPQALRSPRPYLLIGGGGEKKTLKLVAKYADACNFGIGPEAAHKLDVLRRHCDDVGRDYAEIEKTAMFSIDPASTTEDVVRNANAARDAGFTVAYVYAHDITTPSKITDMMGEALTRL